MCDNFQVSTINSLRQKPNGGGFLDLVTLWFRRSSLRIFLLRIETWQNLLSEINSDLADSNNYIDNVIFNINLDCEKCRTLCKRQVCRIGFTKT